MSKSTGHSTTATAANRISGVSRNSDPIRPDFGIAKGADNIETNRKSAVPQTSQHLIQPPRYATGNGRWSSSFFDVARGCSKLTWDPAAILSLVSHGYIFGDRTLFREVSCQPWLSQIKSIGDVELGEIPEHGFYKRSPQQIASRLLSLLEQEAETVCRDHDQIYLLTSGGLDSRIVAGVIRSLKDQGRIRAEVRAITWGRAGSRDVEIGMEVARKLRFPWQHLDLSERHFEQNITKHCIETGAMVSPIHLHRMLWFRQIPDDGIVLAGSYGDSIGRAEYSGQNVLELQPHRAHDKFGLLTDGLRNSAAGELDYDVEQFRKRAGHRPEYAVRECEQQGFYMRRMISQAMSVIDGNCRLYQMFTDPSVFQFMWSIHPAFRDNRPYAAVLNLLGNDLARLPWARTGRPLSGKPGIKIRTQYNRYHEYENWLMDTILPSIDLDDHAEWLADSNLFDRSGIRNLIESAAHPDHRKRATDLIAWTISLRNFASQLPAPIQPVLLGKETSSFETPQPPPYSSSQGSSPQGSSPQGSSPQHSPLKSVFRAVCKSVPLAAAIAKRSRRALTRRKALKEFPVQNRNSRENTDV